MKTSDFSFELPSDLVAQYPLEQRSASRLLYYQRSQSLIAHRQFKQLPDLLVPGDVLVMNNTRVMPARFYGYKLTGGRIEGLVERKISDDVFLAHIKGSRSLHPGMVIDLDVQNGPWKMTILEKHPEWVKCQTNGPLDEILTEIGHIPLPPYIARPDETPDIERYQTVYAKDRGSVAAPTAGLHFDADIIQKLQNKGIILDYVTLHVGAGTFQPVRSEFIHQHQMHSEFFTVSDALCETVNKAKVDKRRVIAVGTTALRSLESAAYNGLLMPKQEMTNIFIYPGYQFQICDGLMTNFHLPESSLLMLVSAFIGHKAAMNLYQEAIHQKYRFYSYGDTSLLL